MDYGGRFSECQGQQWWDPSTGCASLILASLCPALHQVSRAKSPSGSHEREMRCLHLQLGIRGPLGIFISVTQPKCLFTEYELCVAHPVPLLLGAFSQRLQRVPRHLQRGWGEREHSGAPHTCGGVPGLSPTTLPSWADSAPSFINMQM